MVHLLSLSLLAGLSAVVSAVPTIEVKGSKLFTSEGNQFYVKGIAYQLIPDDPLIDATQCGLDSALMKTLGANSIRVYHVDPDADHTECMKTFADAGIYLWVDLDTFDTQVEQNTPRWETDQRDAFAKVMDAFEQFDNVAGFFIGNEAITTANGSVTAPYIKAATRDMKAYRDKKGYRNIPIGYSAADIASLRPMLQNYLACGTNADDRLDFFSLNAYSWCGQSTYEQSGYNMLEKNSEDLHIPIFMSETGCNTVRPRDFADQNALFGEMADVWSGSIVYEWIEEMNNYGIISYGPKVDAASPSAPPDGFPRSGKPSPVEPDFGNLSKVWATLSPTGVKASDYSPTQTPVACPAYTSGAWEVNPSSPLPTLGQKHDFNESPTSGSFSATPTSGSGTQGGAKESGSGTGAKTSAPASTGAAAGGLGMELKSVGAVFAAVMGVLAWL
ncbi:13-beta-glucanosyltransferase [Pyrenophora tritici-repentis]|uniref:1,3-beta-glucanosyltransferase n=1 Tax=Pyrenophora tritici-repentis TaxID=45151 RepID=A0A2W1GSJ0_9PLEO|nr:1 3-beta-glucanosyltransferase [Pyrenophora tritici-repentis]KAF7452648.1 1-3-beta-glucanosyltransferase [Pyrenophora tritici-repentis]KAF7574214.1 1,3-beta-glucanosyltransferase gel3 precursor [Pyrenophora tritici-repentis]KAI0578393.1 1-3-beta-glucanosyltransferase [Pyrenophora tritici-repentis]KAI0584151.1 1-3-beta-glucanosyltransferase [Pyrenophora tritici-repentis]